MRKGSFSGTGAVFGFTLGQYLKSRSTIVSMVVMLLVSVLSLFIASVSMSKGMVEMTELSSVHIVNETAYDIAETDVRAASELLGEVQVVLWDDMELAQSAADAKTAVARVTQEADGALLVAAGGAEGTELSQSDLSLAAQAVRDAAMIGRSRAMEIEPELIEMIFAPVQASAGSIAEHIALQEQQEDTGFDARYLLTFVYAILVMVLVNFSSSYIVHAVIEEKASRLVETLMISVKPMALIAGKILAAMCLVVIELLLMAAGFGASWLVSSRLLGMKAVTSLFAQAGLGEILAGLDIGSVLMLVFSVLMAFAFYALIAGLAGVRCSNMEDVESANVTVVLTVMTGYIISVSTTAVGGSGAVVLSLLPVVNAFVAPVRYLMGEIGMGILLLSYLVQAISIVALALFCHRVYGALLMYRGRKMKMKEILAMAGGREESEA